jgi:hypothetical protein
MKTEIESYLDMTLKQLNVKSIDITCGCICDNQELSIRYNGEKFITFLGKEIANNQLPQETAIKIIKEVLFK